MVQDIVYKIGSEHRKYKKVKKLERESKRHRAGKMKRLPFLSELASRLRTSLRIRLRRKLSLPGSLISRSAPLVPCRANRQTNRVGSRDFAGSDRSSR